VVIQERPADAIDQWRDRWKIDRDLVGEQVALTLGGWSVRIGRSPQGRALVEHTRLVR
jgi:hypothetical protein